MGDGISIAMPQGCLTRARSAPRGAVLERVGLSARCLPNCEAVCRLAAVPVCGDVRRMAIGARRDEQPTLIAVMGGRALEALVVAGYMGRA